MQIPELKRQLADHAVSGGYFFCGEEEYLKRYYRDALRGVCITDPAYDSFDHAVFDGPIDVAELRDALKTLPLVSPKRLVEWNHAPIDSLSAAAKTALCEIGNKLNNSSESVLVICADAEGFAPGSPKHPTETMKMMSAAFQTVLFEKNGDAQLMAWLARHFARDHLLADPDVLREMLARCGHSMEDLAHELDKVICYAHAQKKERVTVADVDFVCSVNRENDVFALTNALLDGNAHRAFDCLAEMKSNRVDASLIMGQLAKFWADLSAVSALLAEGKNPPAIASALKMNEYKTGLYARAARRMGNARVRSCLAAVRDTDLYLKSVYVNPYSQIEILLARACS